MNPIKIMKKSAGLIIALCMLACAAAGFSQGTILLQADYWMPFNGDGVGETGYILDLAREIFNPLGYTVEFQLVPWSRAIAQVREGQANGVVGALADDAEGFVFPSEEQGISMNNFFVLAGNPWVYKGIGSLKDMKIGIISDYSYFDELDGYIEENPSKVIKIFGDAPQKSLIQVLLRGGVGAIVEDNTVMMYTLGKMNLKEKVILADSSRRGEKLFIAFSPKLKNSAMLAQTLSDGMKYLRQNGKLAKILAKYGLKDWK